jgi:hypothetical protein
MAVGKYNRHTRTALDTDRPTKEALAAIIGRKGRICPLECDDDEREVAGRCVAKVAPAKPAARGSRPPASSAPARKSPACTEWERCVTFTPGYLRGRCGLQPSPC